jgi:orotate phosphoribosyltransferase
MLGYQMALIARKPVRVSYDREGVIALETGNSISQGSRALIAADVHFTTNSIQAAAYGIEQAGLEVMGAAILLQITRGDYAFPLWTLESRT